MCVKHTHKRLLLMRKSPVTDACVLWPTAVTWMLHWQTYLHFLAFDFDIWPLPLHLWKWWALRARSINCCCCDVLPTWTMDSKCNASRLQLYFKLLFGTRGLTLPHRQQTTVWLCDSYHIHRNILKWLFDSTLCYLQEVKKKKNSAYHIDYQINYCHDIWLQYEAYPYINIASVIQQ